MKSLIPLIKNLGYCVQLVYILFFRTLKTNTNETRIR